MRGVVFGELKMGCMGWCLGLGWRGRLSGGVVLGLVKGIFG